MKLSSERYVLSLIDTCRDTPNQKSITFELVQGHWPCDQELKEVCLYEKEWGLGTITVLSERIKMITKVNKGG